MARLYTKDIGHELTIFDIEEELWNAEQVFKPFNSTHEGFCVLQEEVDELKELVYKTKECRYDGRVVVPEEMRQEAIQVAAMAIRFIKECC